MKRLLLAMIAAGAIIVPTTAVWASPTLPTPTPSPVLASSKEQQARMNKLKTTGASEIDRRLDSLQRATEKLTTGTMLAETDRKKMEAQAQAETTNLVALKSKLSANTDLEAARKDAQTIVKSYGVYGLLLPKLRLVATIDRLMAVEAELQPLRANLQHKITAARGQGKEVTNLQRQLDDMRTRLAEAKKQYDGIVPKIIDIQTRDYPAAYQTLAGYRDGLKVARVAQQTAYEDGKAIIDGLGELKDATPTHSPLLSTSPSPAKTAAP